jgi:hypothetical protein
MLQWQQDDKGLIAAEGGANYLIIPLTVDGYALQFCRPSDGRWVTIGESHSVTELQTRAKVEAASHRE